jgi:hypothetical protein
MISDPARLEETVRQHDEEWHEAVGKLREAAKRPL